MFCTKCGQEQVSESMRFCSRCGFKLNTVEEGLPKRLIVMAMYLVITICAIIGWGSISAGPGYMHVRVLITIIAAVAFYLLFAGDLTQMFNKLFSQKAEQKQQIAAVSQKSALAPAPGISGPFLESHRVNTGEMVQPPSVTEQTTRLLSKDKH